MSFFQRLNFTSANEDGASEIAALANTKRILCLTGSGGRALDLLMTNAEDIIALDMNQAQNALLALKIAAIRHLSYQDYLGFIGVVADNNRLKKLAILKENLSPEYQVYWQKNHTKIEHGLWYSGLWERLLHINAQILKLFKGRKIKALFAATTLQEQEKIWQKAFDNTYLLWMIKIAANRLFWTHIIHEPGGNFLPSPDKVAKIIEMRFKRGVNQFLFRESDFATLIFKGKQTKKLPPLPVHMQPDHYQYIKENLGRIRIITNRLDKLDIAETQPIDGFSLSDFGSYCNSAQYHACWQGIITAAAKSAIFCERLFMVDHSLPFANLCVNESLSRELSAKDRSIIYQIRVGVIQ